MEKLSLSESNEDFRRNLWIDTFSREQVSQRFTTTRKSIEVANEALVEFDKHFTENKDSE